ncbi:MAG: hypothetical protein LUI06_00400 [Ruminococcus sp.]|nr:hypothetical protein [Ruminococcus sp.]
MKRNTLLQKALVTISIFAGITAVVAAIAYIACAKRNKYYAIGETEIEG